MFRLTDAELIEIIRRDYPELTEHPSMAQFEAIAQHQDAVTWLSQKGGASG